MAVPAFGPMRSVPVLTALTTNASTVPSTSVSLPCVFRLVSVIVACASSSTVSTAAEKEVSVGILLTDVTVRTVVESEVVVVPSST